MKNTLKRLLTLLFGGAIWDETTRAAAETDRLGRWSAWFRFRRRAELVLTVVVAVLLVALYAP